MSTAGDIREKNPTADDRGFRRHDCGSARGKIFGKAERLKLNAAGDVREKEIRQLTTAASDGTTAALLAEKFLAKLRG